MKDKIKKIVGWRPGAPLYACVMAAALVFLLVPLIRVAAYSVPWYDDYNYGRFAKMAMEDAPTFANALKGAWECIRISWYAWQGTYASILFMALMPGIWGEEYYCFGPIFLILFLTVSVCVLACTLLRNVLKADWQHALGIAAVSAVMAVELIYTAQAGFYWYNGGVHYVGMHSFAMLMTAVAVNIFCSDKRWKRMLEALLGVVLALLVAGGNFVTALQGLLVLLSIVGLGCLLRRHQTFAILPMFCAYVGGFWLNVTAPGNDKRAESYVGWGMSPVKAVLASFKEGFGHMWTFTGWMGVLLLVLMLPLVWNMVKKTDFSFRWPGVVSLWSLCLYATGFTPSLYSLGHAGLGRTLNAVKLTWQLLLICNTVYWCGWLCRCLERKGRTVKGQMSRWWFYPLVAAAAFVIFSTETNRAGSFSSYGAYYYIHTGEGYNFYQEYLERVALLRGDEDTVVLSPYHWRPWFLCMGDLSADPEDDSNRALAVWYGKDEVICSNQAVNRRQ
jgi:hypothetical protein